MDLTPQNFTAPLALGTVFLFGFWACFMWARFAKTEGAYDLKHEVRDGQ
jgi:hypothetical protein